jgi:hypothetical protein
MYVPLTVFPTYHFLPHQKLSWCRYFYVINEVGFPTAYQTYVSVSSPTVQSTRRFSTLHVRKEFLTRAWVFLPLTSRTFIILLIPAPFPPLKLGMDIYCMARIFLILQNTMKFYFKQTDLDKWNNTAFYNACRYMYV